MLKRVICFLLSLVMVVGPISAGAAWYDESVAFCVQQGAWVGAETGAEALISKIEFLALISRALKLYDGEAEGGQAHAEALRSAGILNQEEFPRTLWAQPLCRLEAARVLYKALAVTEGYDPQGAYPYWAVINDRLTVPGVDRDAVNAVCGQGLMGWVGGELTFAPWRDITRAEAAVMAARLMDPARRAVPPVPTEWGKLMGEYTTSFGEEWAQSDPLYPYRQNSIYNMIKAGNLLNGAIIAPGTRFSYKGAAGSATYGQGYLKGIVVSAGQLAAGEGGGVCQTSTTLFNAALRAGMTITERRSHSRISTYVPAGADSSISGKVDLKFVNPYDCAVKIVYITDDTAKTMTCYLLGAAGTYTPQVRLDIQWVKGTTYQLTRYSDGTADYSTSSTYYG